MTLLNKKRKTSLIPMISENHCIKLGAIETPQQGNGPTRKRLNTETPQNGNGPKSDFWSVIEMRIQLF